MPTAAEIETVPFPLILSAPAPAGGANVALAGSNAAASVPSRDRKSTRLNSSHQIISYAVFCLKKKIRARYELYVRRIHQDYGALYRCDVLSRHTVLGRC